MLSSVLVANRGEIAVRIFRTCRRLGIRSIAVYSDADARALHVAEADEAIHVGPPRATDSYLNQSAILEAARRSKAAAIHPGYGFLAENPDFAQAVIDAGLAWIGPSPEAMRALGDKAHARALAEQHGVPVLPGYHGAEQNLERLEREASRIGYPLLIKAPAGGGGRGMRVVEWESDFEPALETARRETLASFGDDRVLMEKYVRRSRHVEVQIVGDKHGHVIHLGERECSVQRRYQKLIEESPSPAVDASLRAKMGEAALRLAHAAAYTNTGTVEFLLDEQGEFYFLEVNARLQVEHPVTEAVAGLDLVELQLKVAANQPLPLAQEEVTFSGHAIEARVIAEDALSGFLPSSGTIKRVEWPPLVRIDTWVTEGTSVSPYYDSLLAKVIAHDADRSAALRGLARALRETWIDGVADNLDLLLATVEHPAFVEGELHTSFLDEHKIAESVAEVPPPVMAAVSALDSLAPSGPGDDPWRQLSAWRLGRIDQPASWSRAGRLHAARVSADLADDVVLVATTAGETLPVRLVESGNPLAKLSVGGHRATVWDYQQRRVVHWEGRGYRLLRGHPLSVDETAADRGVGGAAGRLTAPMPGRVVRIAIAVGQQVTQNQPLLVLEAMKMEHLVEAPHAGVVAEIYVQVGAQVTAGAQLLVLSGTTESTDAPEPVE